MHLIYDHLPTWDTVLPRIALRVDRGILAKRRWRGTADDGAEFGFDLARPLNNGDVFHATGHAVYALDQKPEMVLEVALGADAVQGARLGWLIGNLHFPIGIGVAVVQVPDDPAVRQLLERERLAFSRCERVFCPLGGGHAHSHEHEHH